MNYPFRAVFISFFVIFDSVSPLCYFLVQHFDSNAALLMKILLQKSRWRISFYRHIAELITVFSSATEQTHLHSSVLGRAHLGFIYIQVSGPHCVGDGGAAVYETHL